ncbi:hypothetical protein FGIG_09547 [Fasciola gigantica]|uniref:G-protein coupled receptors family 2 profile 1 domain-containing protein n=1 Tax=Fasciola gigantica TaxID=46835 RepID=A0A504YMF2_FASGI|nr:hypothetical protein FGIG_09547 [Fasciola gigantica]
MSSSNTATIRNCSAYFDGQISWPDTLAGQMAQFNCPYVLPFMVLKGDVILINVQTYGVVLLVSTNVLPLGHAKRFCHSSGMWTDKAGNPVTENNISYTHFEECTGTILTKRLSSNLNVHSSLQQTLRLVQSDSFQLEHVVTNSLSVSWEFFQTGVFAWTFVEGLHIHNLIVVSVIPEICLLSSSCAPHGFTCIKIFVSVPSGLVETFTPNFLDRGLRIRIIIVTTFYSDVVSRCLCSMQTIHLYHSGVFPMPKVRHHLRRSVNKFRLTHCGTMESNIRPSRFQSSMRKSQPLDV